MGSTELTAHTRLPLRNDRKAEPCHKDAFIQQHVTHFDGRRRLPDDYSDDRGLSRQWFEPGLGDRASEVARVVVQLLHQLWVVLQLADRCERAGRYGRRQSIREQLRS